MELPSYAALGLAGGAVAALWTQIKTVWNWVSGQVVRTIELKHDMYDVMRCYLNTHFTLYRPGKWTCIGMANYVKPVKDYLTVGSVVPGGNGVLYRRGAQFVFFREGSNGPNRESSITITFLRGNFNEKEFLIAALDYWNAHLKNQQRGNRFSVEHHYGRRAFNLGGGQTDNSSPGNAPVPTRSPSATVPLVYLKWKAEDMGQGEDVNALDCMALDAHGEKIIKEIDFWLKHKDWCAARDVPWRRGYLCHGAPGTGKTSFARAVARSFDMPIHVFDLSSLTNEELNEAWRSMISRTGVPVMALIEDIDGVFNGRENVTKNKTLTFDCLLNCIDGVEKADGVLLWVTTNHLEKVDPAIADRPGRVDRKLEMRAPDASGRYKIAKRILSDWPEHWNDIVEQGDGETGSTFQNRCVELAMKLQWKKLT